MGLVLVMISLGGVTFVADQPAGAYAANALGLSE
jgi:hypothetical protein